MKNVYYVWRTNYATKSFFMLNELVMQGNYILTIPILYISKMYIISKYMYGYNLNIFCKLKFRVKVISILQ